MSDDLEFYRRALEDMAALPAEAPPQIVELMAAAVELKMFFIESALDDGGGDDAALNLLRGFRKTVDDIKAGRIRPRMH